MQNWSCPSLHMQFLFVLAFVSPSHISVTRVFVDTTVLLVDVRSDRTCSSTTLSSHYLLTVLLSSGNRVSALSSPESAHSTMSHTGHYRRERRLDGDIVNLGPLHHAIVLAIDYRVAGCIALMK